jgi:hypothetical protein
MPAIPKGPKGRRRRRTEQTHKFWLVIGIFFGAAFALVGVISAVSGSQLSN